MDRCPKIEFSRLYGELGWHGFNSGVMSSKRRMPGQGASFYFSWSFTVNCWRGRDTLTI